MEENNNVINNNNIQISNEKKSNINCALLIIIIILLLLLGIAGYFLFIKKNKCGIDSQNQEEKININYEVLNYQCEKEYCDSEDYANVEELLKTNDRVTKLFNDAEHKNHAVLLESVDNGNVYLYMVDKDKYYFKNDNYYFIDIINESYESVIRENYDYYDDYDYAIVHQEIFSSPYEKANSKIYSFKDEKYVFEIDEYHECAYTEYENQRFYKLRHNSDITLYDNKFNKLFDADIYGDFAFDDKYIFGIIKENSNYKFFKYDIATKKYELSNVLLDYSDGWEIEYTYNYIVKNNENEFEIYDFDGNKVFKTDEKSNLKNIKAKDYVLPEYPQIYYSKKENKIKLIIEPSICGDISCPPYLGYSYYEYDIGLKKMTYEFFNDTIPDSIYKNLFDGYAEI